jgi:hypothetical protein
LEGSLFSPNNTTKKYHAQIHTHTHSQAQIHEHLLVNTMLWEGGVQRSLKSDSPDRKNLGKLVLLMIW